MCRGESIGDRREGERQEWMILKDFSFEKERKKRYRTFTM
jgi:hypothetical protein